MSSPVPPAELPRPELSHSELFPDGIPSSPWRFLWAFVRRRFAGRTVLLNLTAAGGIALMGLEPAVLRSLVDELSVPHTGSAGWSRQVLVQFLLLGGLWIVSALFNRAREVVEIATAPALRLEIQSVLFSYLIGHSPRYFQDNFAGKLGQKIKQAGQSGIQLVGILTNDVIRILVILGIGIALLYGTNPLFAALMVGWTVLYLPASALLARRCLELSHAYSDEVSSSTGQMVDAISNIELVRAFARSGIERRIQSEGLRAELRRSKTLRWYLTKMWLVLFTALILFQTALIGIAVSEAIDGRMGVGDFAMVFSLASIVGINVWGLATRMLDFFEQLGTLSGALDLIARPHEIADRPGAGPLLVTGGRIDVRGLCFAHADGTAVFKNLSLEVAAGERVALVGPSGAGKSTLLRLLRRQFVHRDGSILIDGQDTRHVTLDSLNAAIAEVPQAPGLFHRPVRDNIAYARPDASWEEVLDASRRARCHEFIERRTESYDTIVGEQGVRLSGGERQRIAIARAFLKDAPILLLDEATSSLDSETEHLIQEALWDLFKGRTVIAIAHRLSTVTGMDRILYMEQGRILEDGSHAALVARDGPYARLWRRQVGGFLPTEDA